MMFLLETKQGQMGQGSTLVFILIWFSLSMTLTDCTRADPNLRTEACFTTQHHEKVIPNIDVYVKFQTTAFPGYDHFEQFNIMKTSDANGRVCFRDLPLGDHWFVAIGYDEGIREQVIGSIDLRFDLKNLKVDQILYVGEE
jgi:hypothetical protein